ncbi:protein ANTAGONIST OF LIKE HETEROCHROMATIN PROTEIN 1 [Oryzias melastigma]|uniref:Protein ANTAGONIST OF LIKE HETEROCHROMATIN PROTEIN 1-like n=1 Tax=Oryzias melastigma TaxID=30732 RepID=A0A3B3D5R6_ORYME|nr:protein ANTAGONIST OF LIKE HETEROCHROMATIN PROTEIN 1 [Oryzias melastigma]
MEVTRQLVVLVLSLWYFTYAKNLMLFARRLREAKKNTAEKRRKLLAWISSREKMCKLVLQRQRRRRHMIMLQLLLKNQRRSPVVWAFSRASEWWNVTVPGFTDTQWVQNFRMTQETFTYLCARLRPAMEKKNTNFRACLPLRKRVAIALWKLATNSEYRSIGHLFGVSKSSVCRCVQDLCKAVCAVLLPELIRFPDPEKLKDMADRFETRWGLPQCVGAIGGSHIPIIAPQEHHTDNYLNPKGRHSILLQGVVDGEGQFWSVDAGQPGSLHHAGVLRSSSLWDFVQQGGLDPACTKNIGGVSVGYYLLGDSAYPQMNWILKPFPENGRLTAEQQTFNEKTSSARVVVGRAFGRLKGRWQCLLKRNDCDIELVNSMVLACCALHNLCESRGEDYQQEWETAEEEPVPSTPPDVDEEESEERRGLMRHLNTQ